MSKRATSENSDTVGLFPFLAVLLCTMGALLVILVVLVQRAAERAALEAATQPEPAEQTEPQVSAPVPTPEATQELATLKRELDEVHQYHQQLKKRRAKAEARLRDEQARLSHLEEHTRRLEHDLAQLSIAAQQLEATEKNQTVDQQQAENELVHLKSLINENEDRLAELREQSDGNRSYSIVPYQGPNGTYRKPIYIECCREGVIIHPEGIHFTESDFAETSWPGNPLAAALRASREYLNAQAAKAGEPEPPDPYPLLLIRPDGVEAYSAARAAIASWDSDYGYEFIAGDWKLDFPELPDPILAQMQNHAVMNARDNMAMLARAAPSRFNGMGSGGNSAYASRGNSGSRGFGQGGQNSASTNGSAFANSPNGGSPNGNGLAAGQAKANYDTQYPASAGQAQQSRQESQFGAMPGGLPENEAGGQQTAGSGNANSEPSASGSLAGTQGANQTARQDAAGETLAGGSPQNSAASGSLAQSGSPNQSSSGGSTDGTSSTGSSQAAASGGSSAGGAQASSASRSFSNAQSIADSRGSDWAVDRHARGSFPISRPIQVIVRKNQLSLLPGRHTTSHAKTSGTTVSLNQPVDQISQEFLEVLRTHIEDWGLAGNGLYWRPILELKVGPEAQQTAYEITRLLKNSGVEVRLPEMAQAGQREANHAPK